MYVTVLVALIGFGVVGSRASTDADANRPPT